MELADVMRQMPGCRDYETRDVPDDVLYRVLDNARFAPSGGNRQGWRVVVVRDAALRRQMSDLYQLPWQRYVTAHYGAYEDMTEKRRRAVDDANRMADTMHLVPVHLVIWADIAKIAVTDIDADRPSIVAGGSIFPFIQNVQLAARAEGLGTRITTLLSYSEAAVRSLLHMPDDLALAALLLVGWPARLPTKLSRKPVETFAWIDRHNGEPLRP